MRVVIIKKIILVCDFRKEYKFPHLSPVRTFCTVCPAKFKATSKRYTLTVIIMPLNLIPKHYSYIPTEFGTVRKLYINCPLSNHHTKLID